MTIDDFFKQMTIFFPTIEKELNEHIEEFGERLDTMAIEDIIMPNVIHLIEIAKRYMGPITNKYQREADLDLGRIIE